MKNMGNNKIKSILVIIIFMILFTPEGIVLASDVGKKSTSLSAFTVNTPVNGKWKNLSKPNHLIYKQSIEDKYSTIVLEAFELPLSPEPIKSISYLLEQAHLIFEKRKNSYNGGRNEMTSHFEEIYKINNLECVKYQKNWIDHGGIATNNKELIMLAIGLICIHPESDRRLVEISYSSRNSSGYLQPEAKVDGEKFINSICAKTLSK